MIRLTSRPLAAAVSALVVALPVSVLAAPSAGRARSATAAIKLAVEPEAVTLSGPRSRQQLLVTAVRPDGTRADVTAKASYTSPSPVEVSASGAVRPLRDGAGRLQVRLREGGRVVAEASVPVAVRGAADEAPISFTNEVIPALTQAGCNQGACHGAQHGKGGFKLSLLGFDPEVDFEAMTREGGGRRIARAEPGNSLLLLKGTAAVPHAGGLRLQPSSPQLSVLKAWLGDGAPGPITGEPLVSAITASPEERTMRAGERQQLRVTARYTDGSARDVTRWARFNTNNDGIAGVGPEGLVRGAGPGATALMIRYQGQVAVARVAVPFAQMARYPAQPSEGFIDELVTAEWRKLGLLPSPTSTDAEFIRRVSVDLTGTLPEPERVAAFVADKDPKKREKLADELLGRAEWVDYWTLYFGDLLRNNRMVVGEKGMWAFRSWMQESLRQDKPYNQMVRELIDVRGSTYRNPASNYYNVVRTPEELAETTSQVFLGIRLTCAKCHDHPFEKWSQNDYYRFAAFFARVQYKGFPDIGSFGGDQLVLLADEGEVKHPKTGKAMEPRPLTPMTVPAAPGAGTAVDSRKRLTALASWLADPQNPFVARNIVNRIWARLMGRGLIDPVDDIRASNPPTHPALLDALTADFVAHKLSLRYLMRQIVTSRTYQLSSAPTKLNAADAQYYSRYYARRLTAEQLLDALCQVTGVPEKFQNLPEGTRAIALPDVQVRNYFLETFGRPARVATCECERDNDPNLAQVLHLANSGTVQGKIGAEEGRLAQLLRAKKSDSEIIETFYRLAYSRPPDREELETVLKLIPQGAGAEKGRREVLEDLVWTLLNSKEFLLNH